MKLEQCDLHVHSSYSDGQYTPDDLADKAIEAGLDVFSVTDHDSIGAYEGGFQDIIKSVHIVPGVEITAGFKEETIHLLGYCFDPRDRNLASFLHSRRIARENWAFKLFPGEENRPLTFRGKSLTLKDIRDALIHTSSSSAAESLIKKEKKAMEKASAKKTISVIHEAGGVAILAHPGLYTTRAEFLIRHLKPLGLDGIEIFYPYTAHCPHLFPSRDKERCYFSYLLALSQKYGLLVTGGSDTHNGRLHGWPLEKLPSLPCFFW